jgi:hypothetical protein
LGKSLGGEIPAPRDVVLATLLLAEPQAPAMCRRRGDGGTRAAALPADMGGGEIFIDAEMCGARCSGPGPAR